MGIDMSSAFGTISQKTILNLFEDVGCTEDEIRLVRLLLSSTKLHVRVGKSTSNAVFISLSGAFQGDSLSGEYINLMSKFRDLTNNTGIYFSVICVTYNAYIL